LREQIVHRTCRRRNSGGLGRRSNGGWGRSRGEGRRRAGRLKHGIVNVGNHNPAVTASKTAVVDAVVVTTKNPMTPISSILLTKSTEGVVLAAAAAAIVAPAFHRERVEV
jgi:hypothetical protein